MAVQYATYRGVMPQFIASYRSGQEYRNTESEMANRQRLVEQRDVLFNEEQRKIERAKQAELVLQDPALGWYEKAQKLTSMGHPDMAQQALGMWSLTEKQKATQGIVGKFAAEAAKPEAGAMPTAPTGRVKVDFGRTPTAGSIAAGRYPEISAIGNAPAAGVLPGQEVPGPAPSPGGPAPSLLDASYFGRPGMYPEAKAFRPSGRAFGPSEAESFAARMRAPAPQGPSVLPPQPTGPDTLPSQDLAQRMNARFRDEQLESAQFPGTRQGKLSMAMPEGTRVEKLPATEEDMAKYEKSLINWQETKRDRNLYEKKLPWISAAVEMAKLPGADPAVLLDFIGKADKEVETIQTSRDKLEAMLELGRARLEMTQQINEAKLRAHSAEELGKLTLAHEKIASENTRFADKLAQLRDDSKTDNETRLRIAEIMASIKKESDAGRGSVMAAENAREKFLWGRYLQTYWQDVRTDEQGNPIRGLTAHKEYDPKYKDQSWYKGPPPSFEEFKGMVPSQGVGRAAGAAAFPAAQGPAADYTYSKQGGLKPNR